MSDDGGPYALWQSQTTATGAFFSGTNGHTYAFYSIATDTVGNREAIPLQPEAETTVNSTNYPPSLFVRQASLSTRAKRFPSPPLPPIPIPLST